MVTKSEFQNIYSCIKVSKNLRLNNQYVFNGKENFINFIKKLRNLLSNSDEKILYDIELSNEFGVLRLKSLDSLFKNINKYKSVYHLSITMIDTNNKKCHNAIEFSFQLLFSEL